MSRSVGEHIRCPEGTVINGRFKVLKEIGCGNFAKVYKCTDVQHPNATPVAVKILKKEYAADAAFEADILKALGAKDSRGHKVVRMLDQFVWSRCPCFVFTLRGAALRARKLGVARGHVSMDELRRFTRQMLETLAFLHQDVRMVHTDLKPENILIDDEVLPNPSAGIGSGWTIADFGSASFFNPAKPDSDLISTRPYRAPEVVLSLPWSTKADIFSMGCIIFEVYYGARLFEVNEDGDHLTMFERRVSKVPLALSRQSKHFRRFFDPNGALISATSGYATARSSSVPSTQVGSRHLSEVVPEAELRDLLMMMLDLDPSRRASAQDCLRHSFVTGAAFSGAISPLRAQMERMSLSEQAADKPKPVVSARLPLPTSYDKENASSGPAVKQTPRMSPAVPSFAHALPISSSSSHAAAADRYMVSGPASSRATPYSSAAAYDLPLSREVPAAGRPSAFTPRYNVSRW
jgi:serine/threonine protein kinase